MANGQWGKAIQLPLRDHPHYEEITNLAYSDLRGVPFFLKGLIRSKFPQDPERWVLMDWKGLLAEIYEFEPKSSNILIFAPNGSLTLHESGREPDEKTVESIVSALRALLDKHGDRTP